jgi:uncharacterized protein
MDGTKIMDVFLSVLDGMWKVMGEMAPYLLFGFLIAGVLSVFLSPAWIERHLGGRGMMPILKSVLFGVPLPLCSCGVIAVTASIRRHGASRGAATGFLLATPQTGVDSILATWGLLGPVLGIVRPLIALITGFVGGALVSLLDPDPIAEAQESAPSACDDDCCSTAPAEPAILRMLRYSFITLPRDIGNALLFGVILAGLIGALVPVGALSVYLGGGVLAMAAMMTVGIPLYVCSTASIPIAVGFMHMGASPGAALAFLIAGPATNAATLTTVWHLMGRRTALIYLGTVAVGGMFFGLAFDVLAVYLTDLGIATEMHLHEMDSTWWDHGAATLLLIVMVGGMLKPWRERLFGVKKEEAPMVAQGETVVLRVTGLNCSHCENAVARELKDQPGVNEVTVSKASEQAVITGTQLNADTLIAAVKALDYGAEILES